MSFSVGLRFIGKHLLFAGNTHHQTIARRPQLGLYRRLCLEVPLGGIDGCAEIGAEFSTALTLCQPKMGAEVSVSALLRFYKICAAVTVTCI